MKPRLLAWFSCGAASAVNAKIAVEYYRETYEVLIVNCDTRPSEDADNFRFSAECERWFGQRIIYLRNEKYDTVDDVFERERFMSCPRGAKCTTELKKKPRLQFTRPDDVNSFGFTFDEQSRLRKFSLRNPDLLLKWILVDRGIRKQDCFNSLREAGIELPRMYRLGFMNNNCPGCVKASSPWYWDMIRRHYPDVFARRCRQSREIDCRLVEIRHHKRIFLDELPPGPFFHRNELLSCGPECGSQMKLNV